MLLKLPIDERFHIIRCSSVDVLWENIRKEIYDAVEAYNADVSRDFLFQFMADTIIPDPKYWNLNPIRFSLRHNDMIAFRSPAYVTGLRMCCASDCETSVDIEEFNEKMFRIKRIFKHPDIDIPSKDYNIHKCDIVQMALAAKTMEYGVMSFMIYDLTNRQIKMFIIEEENNG